MNHPHFVEDPMRCPFCGEEYVHIAHVEVDQGGFIAKVSCQGVEKRSEQSLARGSQVSIVMYCEDGCVFSINYSFHKGMTTKDVTRLPDDPQLEELWRD